MEKNKMKAVALMLLGLTGILLAFIAGIIATEIQDEALRDLFTEGYLVLFPAGATLLGYGGIKYDRIYQKQQSYKQEKRQRMADAKYRTVKA